MFDIDQHARACKCAIAFYVLQMYPIPEVARHGLCASVKRGVTLQTVCVLA